MKRQATDWKEIFAKHISDKEFLLVWVLQKNSSNRVYKVCPEKVQKHPHGHTQICIWPNIWALKAQWNWHIRLTITDLYSKYSKNS